MKVAFSWLPCLILINYYRRLQVDCQGCLALWVQKEVMTNNYLLKYRALESKTGIICRRIMIKTRYDFESILSSIFIKGSLWSPVMLWESSDQVNGIKERPTVQASHLKARINHVPRMPFFLCLFVSKKTECFLLLSLFKLPS